MPLFQPEFLESSLLLKSIFDTANDGIITINKSGIIQMVNMAICELFQYESDELIGKNISILMPEPHNSEHNKYLENYITSGEKKIIGIGRKVDGLRKDGTLFPIRLSVSEIQVNGHLFFTGILHDLSEQRKVEENIKKLNLELEERVRMRTNELSETVEKLLTTNKQLAAEVSERKKIEQLLRETESEIRTALEKEKELNELKSRFVTMASHEFRTPLSTILSSAALIEMYDKEGQETLRKKHLLRIRSSIGNLTNILNDFLSLSKLEEGKIKSNPEFFSLVDFCSETIDEIKGLLKPDQKLHHENIQLEDLVYMDKHLLKNILFNLLSNAIKYSSSGQTIYCKNEIIDDHIVITIKDEGIGIPKSEQAHLFTRFFRASNVTNIQGSGLGLNIVKRYVDLMDGTVSFTSDEGAGTTFLVSIPKNKKDEKDSAH